MYFVPTIAAILCLLPASSAFEFTLPDPNNKLNLSAPSIEIAWDREGGSGGAEYQQVDIWFQATGESNTFSWGLEANVSANDGNYTWDPREIKDLLTENRNTLLAAKVHHFEARLHNANSSAGAQIESDEYEVEGYDNIVSGANVMRSRNGGLLVASGVFMVMAWSL